MELWRQKTKVTQTLSLARPATSSAWTSSAELRRLKEAQPDLSAAADLQIELLQVQRRIQTRVSLPSIRLEAKYLNDLLKSGPILQFEHLPVDWSDLRFLLRATATAMRNHDALDEADYRRAEELARQSERLPGVVSAWYEAVRPGATPIGPELSGLESVLQQAMRPFLTRAGDAVMARSDLAAWPHGTCPLCGGEPDLAVITTLPPFL